MPPAYPSRDASATAPGASGQVFERRSVLDSQSGDGAKRSSILPIAIAAILVLGLIGGAWAFRDEVQGLGPR